MRVRVKQTGMIGKYLKLINNINIICLGTNEDKSAKDNNDVTHVCGLWNDCCGVP